MSRLVRAELVKLRTVRMTWGLAALAIFFVLTGVVATLVIVTVGTGLDSGADRSDPATVRAVVGGASGAIPVAIVLGVLLVTSEYRHGTITPTFLVEPRRRRVVLAKLVAGLGAGLALGAVCTGLSLLVGLPWLAALTGAATLPASEVVWMALGGTVAVGAWAAIGVGVGGLVRNQVGAIVGVLVWTALAEPLAVSLLPQVGRYLPGGAASSLARLGTEDLLPTGAAAAVMAVYVLVAGAVAVAAVERRDVT